MRIDPLFIRFANEPLNIPGLLNSLLKQIEDEGSRKIIEAAKDNIPDLKVFRTDYKNMLTDLIENGINQDIKNYVNSYMKPSLEEFVDDSPGSRSGEHRMIVIKAADTPWIEAIICYNLCLYLKVYGLSELKKCPVCSKFFCHKGKYGKYCSDSCKSQGFNK